MYVDLPTCIVTKCKAAFLRVELENLKEGSERETAFKRSSNVEKE